MHGGAASPVVSPTELAYLRTEVDIRLAEQLYVIAPRPDVHIPTVVEKEDPTESFPVPRSSHRIPIPMRWIIS